MDGGSCTVFLFGVTILKTFEKNQPLVDVGMSLKLSFGITKSFKSLQKFKSTVTPPAVSLCMMSSPKSADVEYYNGPDVELTNVRHWLSHYQGGSVVLTFDNATGIAEIVLDHPAKRNAISGSMMVQLADIVEKLENWHEGKGVLLRGAGNMFCSGGDLDFARASAGPEGGFKMASFMHNVLSRLKGLPMLSVALIHGQGAIGGGAELATACDWRLMTKDCRGFGLVHTRMGIVPAWGASSRLAAIVGSRVALELISSSRIVPPKECLDLGLIENFVDPGPDGHGVSDATIWLSKHIQAEPEVIRAAKATLTQFDLHVGFSKALEDERRLFAPLWGGPSNRKALDSKIKHI